MSADFICAVVDLAECRSKEGDTVPSSFFSFFSGVAIAMRLYSMASLM